MPRPDDIRLYFQTITAKQARQLLANHRWNGQPVDHVRIIIEYIYICVCVSTCQKNRLGLFGIEVET